MSLLIRPAKPEDYQAIGDLTVAAYVNEGHLDADDIYVNVLRDVAARASAGLTVAVDDATDQVLGSLTLLRPEEEAAEVAREREREFRMLAVHPAARRRGVGRALVSHAIDWAAHDNAPDADPVEALVLTTMVTMTGAHRLYESLGFHRVPSRDWTQSDMGWREPADDEPVYWVYRRELT